MASPDVAPVPSVGSAAPFKKTKVCKFYLMNMCTKGNDCCFAHGVEDLCPLPDLRRTKVCRNWVHNGSCSTPGCTFAHSTEELQTPLLWTNSFKTKMCRFFLGGHCANGSACKFAHHESELRVVQPDATSTAQGQSRRQTEGQGQVQEHPQDEPSDQQPVRKQGENERRKPHQQSQQHQQLQQKFQQQTQQSVEAAQMELWSAQWPAASSVLQQRLLFESLNSDFLYLSEPRKVLVPSVEAEAPGYAEPMYVAPSSGLAQHEASMCAIDRCAAAESAARVLSELFPGTQAFLQSAQAQATSTKQVSKLDYDVGSHTLDTSDDGDARSHASASSSNTWEPTLCK